MGLTPIVIRLLELCRRDRPGLPPSLEALPGNGEVGGVLALAERYRIAGLVGARLEWGAGGIESGLGIEGAERHRSRRRLAVLQDLERDRLLGLLEAAGVQPLLLKGAALRIVGYREPVERPMDDLDLLVAPGQVTGAVAILRRAGYGLPSPEVVEAYRRHHFHIPMIHPGGFLVELHWELTRPGDPFRLESGGFLQRAVIRDRPGRCAARIPASEDLVLHLASQALSEGFGSLRRVVDVDRAIGTADRFDWDALTARANRGSLRYALAHTVVLAERLLGTGIPAEVKAALRMPFLTRVHVELLAPGPAPRVPLAPRRPAAARLLRGWLLPGIGPRLRALGAVLRDPGDPMAWVWRGEASPPAHGSARLQGLLVIAKSLAYQAWLSLEAIAGRPRG